MRKGHQVKTRVRPLGDNMAHLSVNCDHRMKLDAESYIYRMVQKLQMVTEITEHFKVKWKKFMDSVKCAPYSLELMLIITRSM